jgi:exopolyphosphatase/guanosine-5'-triphosphate,3'-diphosphate pyrophosphatase
MRSVRAFAASCGYEENHCRHVAHLAGMIFDQLDEYFPASPEQLAKGKSTWSERGNRLFLEAAALLKDVGYLISYSAHHHHAYHLIIHSDLAGFSPRELQIVANIARYHRKARPRLKHANFASLPKPDRELVCRLAAILRIADGLDRNRLQNVQAVKVQIEDGVAKFELSASENPAVEIWGAESKSDLFERVFGVEPRFGGAGEVTPHGSFSAREAFRQR